MMCARKRKSSEVASEFAVEIAQLRIALVAYNGLVFVQCGGFGAGGRTRTDTTFYGPRILSPVRLPFRHTGRKAQRSDANRKPRRRKRVKSISRLLPTPGPALHCPNDS